MTTMTVEEIQTLHESALGAAHPFSHAAVGVLLQRIADLELQVEMAGYQSAAYLKGEDAGVAAVAARWKEALESPIPAPGKMNEPLEGLYRLTEALRTTIAQMDLLAEAGLCYFTLTSVREYLKDVRFEAEKIGIQGGLTRFTR